MMLTCEICSNSLNNKPFNASEFMLGLKGEFLYFECAVCGCIQIANIPDNISEYYPSNYYSFHEEEKKNKFIQWIIEFARRNLISYRVNGKNLLGAALNLLFRNWYYWIIRNQLNYNSKILDVGCGVGNILLKMSKAGFIDLLGIDPYIQEDIFYNSRLKILKKNIKAISGSYDFIMLHHSFEHMGKPLDVFKDLFNLLNSKSYLLIRIPVASSFAYRKYGVHWVQLDAPRHFFLHTTKSIQILAEKSGFVLKRIIHDSTRLQFVGSEKYLRNIPLNGELAFPKNQLKMFKEQAARLNNIHDGDQACFYLYKP